MTREEAAAMLASKRPLVIAGEGFWRRGVASFARNDGLPRAVWDRLALPAAGPLYRRAASVPHAMTALASALASLVQEPS